MNRIVCLLLLSVATVRAWTSSEVDFPSDHNGFSLSDNSTKYTGPDGSTEWFRYGFRATNTDSSFNFKMVTGNDGTFTQDYGANPGFVRDRVDIMYYAHFSDAASLLAGGTTNGKRYIFTARDPGFADTHISVIELATNEVSIAGVSGGTGTFTPVAGVPITIVLSTNPSPEEKVFVRFTTNNFASDSVLGATISSNVATAVFTNLPPGTYTWYALTTTASSNYLENTNGFSIDALTLAWNNNGGANYQFTAGFNLGNCWHLPTNTEPPGVTMRNPVNDPATNTAVFIYNGNQFQGGGNAGNQSGGALNFRKVGDVTWLSTALVFNSESGDVGNNKYWRGRIPDIFATTNQVEYYVAVNYSDHDTTYLGTTNQATSFTTGLESVARTNTFKYTYSPSAGTAAAFMFHNNNRVLQGSNVQFWVKIGYAQGIGTNRYVDFANIYYTLDGSNPTGSYGLGSSAQSMAFDHMEEDPYEDGDAMWWVGTLTNLPQFTTIKYKIGSYKDTNALERFADYGAGTNNQTFTFSLGDAGVEQLSVNGLGADYTTTKLFIDEIAGDAVTVTVVYATGTTNSDLRAVEIFSNLGRRDFADVDYTNALIAADGIPDGIKGPNGNFITTNDAGAYYRAYSMTNQSGSTYVWTGVVSKTGAYRLTARYQFNTDPVTNWTYYTRNGRRDHAIVVSPKKALEMTLYELNALTVEATDATETGRSTFKDLLGAADGDDDGFDPFNLDYLNFIQANCLWFQPIHPVGFERSENDPATPGVPYAPGSPYATKNYWAVNGKMGADGTEATAMNEFSNYVSKCDAYSGSVGTVNVMLDGVFNHTSWDADFGQGAADLGIGSAGARIGSTRWYWYADAGQGYCDEADFYNSAYDNDVAVAPDRGDFGKWSDVAELYFGRYAALVCLNPQDNGNYLNEGDWFDPSSMTAGVIEIWKYFAYYAEYWLRKTGHSGTNAFALAQDNKGIDGLRCDFGQGLPPQLWEYIINRTRSKKWNFIFMAETLDGGIPGYRSNRHFDILNENLVFQFTQSHINDSGALSYALYARNQSYNGGAILLNITSHDEVLPSDDPWLNAARYGAVSSVAGLPMVFYGQENGIKNFNSINPTYDGFASHELNFGKYVPHFKRWNQLLVWSNPPPDSTGMAQWYGRVNWARLNSPALKSRNNRVLATTGGPEDARIFAVAKWEKSGAGPTNGDVVLAFTRFIEHDAAHTAAANTYNLQPAWSDLGLDTNKLYTIRNLAASDAFALFTNGWPQSGAQLYNNGIYVGLNAGASVNITNDGEVVQYLKVVELTPATPFDSDGDGLYDGWEWSYFASLTNGASGDNDGDGANNFHEFVAHTAPSSADSLFKVTREVSTSNRFVTVATESGRKYSISFADGSPTNSAVWQPFGNTNNGFGTWVEPASVPTNFTFRDDETTNSTLGPPVSGQRTYRVTVGSP